MKGTLGLKMGSVPFKNDPEATLTTIDIIESLKNRCVVTNTISSIASSKVGHFSVKLSKLE